MRDGLSGAIRLDTETGLAPVSSLGVVPMGAVLVVCCITASLRLSSSPLSLAAAIGNTRRAASEPYLMVLPVLRRIH